MVRLGGRPVWSDVDLKIEPGSFVAVLGPNGAGKSTLLKVILGLVPLAAGAVRVFGRPSGAARGRVGYVPQRRHFGPEVRIRGRDLVALGLDGHRWGLPLPALPGLPGAARRQDRRRRVAWALELMGATALADRPIGELSGGEQQRVLIAQALVTRPELLLLDEPLDSLDFRNQRDISRSVREVSAEVGATVLLVAHDVNPLLPFADSICYLAGGGAVTGSPEEVIASDVLSALYGTEIEVLRTRDGQLLVVGRPEGIGCVDHHSEELPALGV